jgi:branched-chain amino acid transport system substrate-binding protein
MIVLMAPGELPGAESDPIKIAAIFSLSGIAAQHNAPMIPMIELGIEEVNKKGGILNRPAELVLLDNKSTPIGSSQAAKEAVRLGVTAVIGAHWSSHSLAIAPVMQEAGIPMISPGSTNPEVTLIGDYIFRMCFLDSIQGGAMARFARNVLKAETAVVVKNINEKYCMVLGEFFAQKFQHEGGEILWEGGYRGKAVDFSDIVQKIKELKPDVVYIPGYTRDSGLIMRQAEIKGVKTVYLGGDGWHEIYTVAGNAAEGSYQTHFWHPGVPYKESRQLIELYRRKFNTEIPNYGAPLAFDAVMLLKDAIERAGTLDRRKIRDALANTKAFKGATGSLRFDKNGDPLNKAVVILQLKDGAKHFIDMAVLK